MIIVRLQGGLGNQLFQYAAALALAKNCGTSVAFDFRFLTGNNKETTPRHFELSHFKIPLNPISVMDGLAFGMSNVPFKAQLKYVAQKISGAHYYSEQSLRFDPAFLSLESKHCYLKGYFQSESYFKHIRNDILNSLPVERFSSVVSAEIMSCNSVSLHIRRGDYAAVESIRKVHGLLPLQYYYSSIEYLKEQLGDIHVFVFSDDTVWARTNLDLPVKTTYVTENQLLKNHRDLLLMSHCKHHIVANSSYSWWGAWLNTNPEKIVIAPNRWFVDEKAEIQSTDIVPEKWIRI